MQITERQLEDICIALTMAKDSHNRYQRDTGQLSVYIFNEWKETGRVIFDIIPEQARSESSGEATEDS